jgi:hypothetical protein
MDEDSHHIRRGEIIGQPNGWKPESDADHFMKCPACGGWFDMRDLGQVLEHGGLLPDRRNAEN